MTVPFPSQRDREDGSLFAQLPTLPPDPLLAIIGAYAADRRSDKIDVGVGVYFDDAGMTPVLRAVKAAEQRLLDVQKTKAYLGAAGDVRFVELLRPILFGQGLCNDPRIAGIQTPGGTGALRLAMELIARARPDGVIHIGLPTWPVHHSVITATRLRAKSYDYFDFDNQSVRFEAMIQALAAGAAGDAVLLQASCHNPTGADLSMEQWTVVAHTCATYGLVPIIDMAYQGLADGLDGDAAGLRCVIAAVDEAIVTYSCDKNFGQYRDRVGAVFVKAATGPQAVIAQEYLQASARAMWSMPPDHGAAVVRLILEDHALWSDWQAQLETMRLRLKRVRHTLSAVDPRLGSIGQQRGLFSTVPLGPERVGQLAREDAIYMASPGRINVAGLRPDQIERFGRALVARL